MTYKDHELNHSQEKFELINLEIEDHDLNLEHSCLDLENHNTKMENRRVFSLDCRFSMENEVLTPRVKKSIKFELPPKVEDKTDVEKVNILFPLKVQMDESAGDDMPKLKILFMYDRLSKFKEEGGIKGFPCIWVDIGEEEGFNFTEKVVERDDRVIDAAYNKVSNEMGEYINNLNKVEKKVEEEEDDKPINTPENKSYFGIRFKSIVPV